MINSFWWVLFGAFLISLQCSVWPGSKKKVFQKQSGLVHIIWNRVVLGEGLMMLYLLIHVLFHWVVVLLRCCVRGLGSSFYFKTAQWSNLQQQFWIWVFKKDLPWSFVHCCVIFQQLWALPVQHFRIGCWWNEGSVPDSVGSGLCAVTSVSWDCPPLSGKDEPQHFPTRDAGRVNLSNKHAFF